MPHEWTDEERGIIRRSYKHTRVSRKAIAKKLGHGISEFAVAGQIAAMGIAKRTDRHPWSPQDDEKLKRLMPLHCPERIAKMMHRSKNSVIVRSQRLGIHRRNHDGWYSKKEVCEILGVDHHWLQLRIDSGALKATYHFGRRPTKFGLTMWHIEREDLKAFIRRYPEEINGYNVEMIQIVDILAGVLPTQRR